MLGAEEMLLDEYKRVDNICRDMFSSRSGISQYITEMEHESFCGRSFVPLWDVDYRRLKRVRWLRNQIAHESYATDCDEEDVAWLEEFHSRLLERRDPLALLKKKNQDRLGSSRRCENRQEPAPEQRANRTVPSQKRDASFSKRGAIVAIGVAAVLVGLFFITAWQNFAHMIFLLAR